MASYGYTQASATAYVKGGMPVLVEGTYEWDETGASVQDITIRWANTGKEISKGFEDSLSPGDWESICDAIADAA